MLNNGTRRRREEGAGEGGRRRGREEEAEGEKFVPSSGTELGRRFTVQECVLLVFVQPQQDT